MDPIQQQILDTIASGEAPDYQTLYGGHKFRSFQTHPSIQIPTPDGGFSTAAGRYQINLPTWRSVSTALGLKDFSPASQDAAAWELAQHRYAVATGRDLQSDAESPLGVQWGALTSTWPSLKRLVPAGSPSSPPPAPTVAGATQLPTGGQINPLVPQSVAQMLAARNMRATPVDYDPFNPGAIAP
jgi:hypothetical protein